MIKIIITIIAIFSKNLTAKEIDLNCKKLNYETYLDLKISSSEAFLKIDDKESNFSSEASLKKSNFLCNKGNICFLGSDENLYYNLRIDKRRFKSDKEVVLEMHPKDTYDILTNKFRCETP